MKTSLTDKEIIDALIKVNQALKSGIELISNQGQALDGFSALAEFRYLAEKAEENRNERK